jgi:archaellum biogenesis ATPase FlaH
MNFIIGWLRVVIEVGLDADPFRGYAGEMKSLSHHVNHFTISNQMKVADLQFLAVDPGRNAIGDASG